MKISVITVCRNSARTILDTLESVRNQTYGDIEHIVCDGGSSDNTVQIVKQFDSSDVRLYEQSDEGIYDAINKGIAHATGDIVAILNSDDFYYNENVLAKVAAGFESGVDSVYGDLVYVKPEDTTRIVRYWKSGEYAVHKFLWGWTVPHPAFFIRKPIYDKFGLYSTHFKISGDYDLILRLLYKNQISTRYIPEVLVKMRTGGASNGNLGKNIEVNREDYQAWKNNKISPYFFTLCLKPFRKLGQYLFLKIK